MPRIDTEPVDTEVARALLAEYVAARAASFPGRAYTPTTPDPAAFTPPAGVFVLLRDGDLPVGCGGIRRLTVEDAAVRYEVKHLFLRPETRGRGWGRLLLEELEQRARSFGATELVLDTHHTLEAAAALYAASGFRTIPPYNDNPNATRWYRKPLT
ncbi:GNAT family N-acetyltransferase [Microbacterium xanthum]|uniref:GNAT family N-acetyltransferase n=1 Tax=Microbacterium xanthum TaxID=3079794 RepID=UPI002AD49FE8|nr:GNAT family N-acetyltransferase [Microbacterium sp. KSW-48]MDZ8171299.1 GNAT family N-acetyltransferase [Microbacterium sp. KSW-48]